MPAQKISISLEEDLVRWINDRAAAGETSVSAIVADAVEALRQHEARLRVLDRIGGPSSEAEVAEEAKRILAAVRGRTASSKNRGVPAQRRAAKRRARGGSRKESSEPSRKSSR